MRSLGTYYLTLIRPEAAVDAREIPSHNCSRPDWVWKDHSYVPYHYRIQNLK